MPCSKGRRAEGRVPDIAARLKRVFGDKIIADQAIEALMDRGAFSAFAKRGDGPRGGFGDVPGAATR